MATTHGIRTVKVAGRFIEGSLDGPDVDIEPDAAPLEGLPVTLTPLTTVAELTLDNPPSTMFIRPFELMTNEDGNLWDPKTGAVVIRILADFPDKGGVRTRIKWRSEVKSPTGAALITKEWFVPLDATEVDLTTVTPVPGTTVINLSEWEALVATTRAAKDLAYLSAQSAQQAKADTQALVATAEDARDEAALSAAAAAAHASETVLATDIPGVTTDGADITAPLNAWLADPGPIKRLSFPPGTYVGSLRVTTPNVRIEGQPGATLKVPDNATKGINDAAIRVVANGVLIDGLTIDGNQTGNPGINNLTDAAVSDGIGIYANDVTVTNCNIFDPIGHGIIVWGLSHGDTPAGLRSGYLIHGNRISGGTNRAALDVAFNQGGVGETKGVISNNRITRNTFVLHSANDVVVSGNYMEGASFHTACERLSITGNINSGHPMNVLSGKDVVVSGNVTSALVVAPGTGAARPTNVTVNGNRATVIQVTKSDTIAVTNNQASVEVNGCTSVVVSGNAATTIRVGNTEAVTGAAITGNQCGQVIVGTLTQFTISNNRVVGSPGHGIGLESCNRGTVRGNRVENSAIAGIRIAADLASCADVVIADNDLDTTISHGVEVGPKGTRITVSNNTFRGIGVREVSNAGVKSVLVNNGASYGRIIVPPASMITEAAPVPWVGANAARFSRFTLENRTILRYLRVRVGAASGNIQVGLVRFTSGTGFIRVMDSGIVACPAAGVARVDLAAYEALPGDYAMFVWSDNTAVTIPVVSSTVAQAARLCSVMVSIPAGVPATGTVYEDAGVNGVVLGLAMETE